MALDIRPEFKRKVIRSFVIRAGRITEGQKLAFDEFWREYGLSLYAGPIRSDQLFRRTAPLVLEVGFGMGDSLLEMARQETDKDFIGIEIHAPGVGRLIKRAGTLGLTNLKVYMADALDVLEECIPDNSLHRFQLYFPDPWHKRKHQKRRIVSPAFVDLIRRKLAPEAMLHFATDWQDYADFMLKVLNAAEGLQNADAEDGFSKKPPFRPVTKFEQRGETLGHGVWDLLFYKHGDVS